VVIQLEARDGNLLHHVALRAFGNAGLAPGEAVECPHSSAVIRRADAMVRNEANAGAVAVARIDNPDLGDFQDAMILKGFGDVPEDFDFARS
jgi:hypothetical protein